MPYGSSEWNRSDHLSLGNSHKEVLHINPPRTGMCTTWGSDPEMKDRLTDIEVAVLALTDANTDHSKQPPRLSGKVGMQGPAHMAVDTTA